MAKINFVFLHGFLGRPSDWDQVISELQAKIPSECYAVNYFSIPPLSPKVGFGEWPDNFAQWILNNLGPGPKVLVGYSLGGRLALHALEKYPDIFKLGICISTNPGVFLDGSNERNARAAADQDWSQRFTRDPWKKLMLDWNSQEIFKSSPNVIDREESEFRRDLLSKALINWSLSQQKDFRSYLKEPKQSFAWIVGQRDQKYIEIAKLLAGVCPQVNFQIIEKSGHRVLFDAPELLAKNIFLTAKNVIK